MCIRDRISPHYGAQKTDKSNFKQELTNQFKGNALLCFSCIIFFIIAKIILILFEQPFSFAIWPYLEIILTIIAPIALISAIILRFLYLGLIKQSVQPTSDLIIYFSAQFRDPYRWAKAIPCIGIMMLGFMAFTDLKAAIPLMNEYKWDESFMRLDQIIHFGQHPWEILQPILGYKTPTVIINFFYNLWFFVLFGFWCYAGWKKYDHEWERQFLLSFIWCWVFGGTVMATIFSSMGPAFYDLINTASNPYTGQMDMLISFNQDGKIYALGTQDLLRESYLNPENKGGLSGISAMPSMHNATSTLFMLAAFRINKVLGYAMVVFLGFIIIGSVHLAWHYAIDSYVGITIALIIWWISGKSLEIQDKFLLYERTSNSSITSKG